MKKIMIILLLVSTVACATARDRVRMANYGLAIALIQTDRGVYDWVETEEGTDVLCGSLVEKYGPDMAACKLDVACQETVEKKLEAECLIIGQEFEAKFDQGMSMSYDAVEALDETLAATGKFGKKDAMGGLSDSIMALNALLDLLEKAGVPVPAMLKDAAGEVAQVLNWLGR